MKHLFTFLLFFSLQFAFAQQTDTTNWKALVSNGDWKTYKSIRKVDSRLVKEFPRWKEISKKNGRFQATDVGGGPRKRLFFVANYKNYWIVSYEHGGIGYHTHCFFVYIKENGEIVSFDTHKEFKNLDELKAFAATNDIPVNANRSMYDY